ncbi:hypothetical protein Tco_0997866 [Tanacetum coccineum]
MYSDKRTSRMTKGDVDSDKLRNDQKWHNDNKLSQVMQAKFRETANPSKPVLSINSMVILKLFVRNFVPNSRVTPSWREIVSLTFSEDDAYLSLYTLSSGYLGVDLFGSAGEWDVNTMPNPPVNFINLSTWSSFGSGLTYHALVSLKETLKLGVLQCEIYQLALELDESARLRGLECEALYDMDDLENWVSMIVAFTDHEDIADLQVNSFGVKVSTLSQFIMNTEKSRGVSISSLNDSLGSSFWAKELSQG